MMRVFIRLLLQFSHQVPTVVIGKKKNVFILPGVPRLFKQMLEAIPESRVNGGGLESRSTAVVDTMCSEGDIAAALLEIAQRFPDVDVGSYPSDPVAHPMRSYRTRLTLEADSGETIENASAMLRELVRIAEEARAAK
jgi:molybdopterin-biosynthesis enzyme MoeA-like protein